MGQNLNSAGIKFFFGILGGDKRLAVPHISVQDIRWVDWDALKAAGFQGCVLDKDNTLSRPYQLTVEPMLVGSLQRCLAAFGPKRVVLYSNSAGLQQYDPQGVEADVLESSLGIPVLRHVEKKPAGGSQELEAYFGCDTSQLVMVGDRYLVDMVFGNRHGMLTILPQPLTFEGEPLGVRLARKVENFFSARWSRAGVQAPPHALAPPASLGSFVKPPSEA